MPLGGERGPNIFWYTAASMTAALTLSCGGEAQTNQGANVETAAPDSPMPEGTDPTSPDTTADDNIRTFTTVADLAGHIGCENPEVTLDRTTLAAEGERAESYEGEAPEVAEDFAAMSDRLLEAGFLEYGICEIEGLFVTVQLYEDELPDDHLVSTNGKPPVEVVGSNWVLEISDFSSSQTTTHETDVAREIAEATGASVDYPDDTVSTTTTTEATPEPPTGPPTSVWPEPQPGEELIRGQYYCVDNNEAVGLPDPDEPGVVSMQATGANCIAE